MGTKSMFTIIDGDHTFRVYMHGDAYLYDAYESIKEAIREFPRFKTRYFGAAFVAANKKFSKTYPGAEVHLTHRYPDCDDLEYRHEVFVKDNETYIKAYEIDYRKELQVRGKESLVFEGSIEGFFNCIDELEYEETKYWKSLSQSESGI